MTVLPSLAEAAPESLTARSALGLTLTTEPVTPALLLAWLGSGVLALTDAVSLKLAPLPRLAGAKTMISKGSEAPAAMSAGAAAVALATGRAPEKQAVAA